MSLHFLLYFSRLGCFHVMLGIVFSHFEKVLIKTRLKIWREQESESRKARKVKELSRAALEGRKMEQYLMTMSFFFFFPL